jgi:hypothetical protein
MFVHLLQTARFRPRPAVRLAVACITLAGCGGTTAPVVAPPPGAARPTQPLCSRITAVVSHARDARRLDASIHGAWQVVHGILAFGPEFPIAHDGRVGHALDYLLSGGRITGWDLRPGDRGVVAVVEEGSTTGQGHPDQWLGYLSQCGLGGIPLDTKLVVAGRSFTLADLLAQAQYDVRPGREATWTLMALAAYLPPDASWTAADGSAWTTERVVQMEADADLSASACGGSHRLTGLALALAAHRKARPNPAAPLTGGWADAADRLADAIERARAFQQPDGSFSTHFFDRPGTSPDVFARLAATGHIFEVLAIALDDDDLAAPWVTRAAERLVTLLEQTRDVDVECGGLYHAIHGLMLYNQRVCPGEPLASIR